MRILSTSDLNVDKYNIFPNFYGGFNAGFFKQPFLLYCQKNAGGDIGDMVGPDLENKIGANSSLMPVEHAAVSHEFYQLPSTILLRFDAQKSASVMLAFAMFLQT